MKRLFTVLALLSLICVLCAIGFAACGDPPYYGKYYSLNNGEEIIINDNGFILGDTAYDYEVNDNYLQLTNYNGNSKKWYRYENDNVISPNITLNFNLGKIPVRNGLFDATLYYASDGTTYSFNSSGNYQIVCPSMPTLSENGTYKLENGLLTLVGNKQLTHELTYTRYYIDANYEIHVFAYVKHISLFVNSENASENETPTTTPNEPNTPTNPTDTDPPVNTNEPTTPTEPNTPEEPVANYELTFRFNSALEGYVVSGYEGTITDSVVIPSTYKNVPVVGIGSDAFFNGSVLKNITIPNTIKKIENNAFRNSGIDLEKIYYTGTVSEWVSTIDGLSSISSYINRSSIYESNYGTLYINNDPVTEVILENITEIKPYALYGCKSLTTIIIPDSVTSIGDYAFNSSGLTSVTIGNNVTRIGSGAFGGSLIKNISIPNSVSIIGPYAFNFCTNLECVTIPASITQLGEYGYHQNIFNNCKSLKTIYLDSAYAVNCDGFADALPEHATDIYILTSIEPTLSVYTIVYEKQDGTVINDCKEYYHYKIKE